jgi:hypothetical protein
MFSVTPTQFCPECDCAVLTGATLPGSGHLVCLGCYQKLVGHAPLPDAIVNIPEGGSTKGGQDHAAALDVCYLPGAASAGPFALPYPTYQTAGTTPPTSGTKGTSMTGRPVLVKGAEYMISTGDEAGSARGVVSTEIHARAEFVAHSVDMNSAAAKVRRSLDPRFLRKT